MASGKKSASKKTASTKTSAHLQEIEELAKLMNRHGISEFEWEGKGERVKMRIGASGHYVSAPVQHIPAPVAHAPAAASAAAAKAPEEKKSGLATNQKQVVSPFVGTFYRAASPTAEPYVRDGQAVKRGDVLCIIEAMKLMNEIEAEFPGKIVSVLVENGQPVEFGEPLFLVET